MIFCVEDDCSIRDLILYTLHSAGFNAIGLKDGVSLFQAIEMQTPKLILLDIMLPGEDGLSLLKRLRNRPTTANIPIIMATAKGTEYDKVIGLDLGADDYLAKPFGMMELVSRVRAVLRRSEKAAPETCFTLGLLTINTTAHLVTAGDKRVQLTLKEYELLKIFLMHPGRVFTREQLLSSVWGTDYVGESRTVDVHIGTLRSKLGPCSAYIETVRGVGYRMEEPL